MEKFTNLHAEVMVMQSSCTTGAAELWLELYSRYQAGNLKASEDAMRLVGRMANPGKLSSSNNSQLRRVERLATEINGSLNRNSVSPQRADKLFTQLAEFLRMTAGRQDGMNRIRELLREGVLLDELAEAALEFRERALAQESVIRPRMTDTEVEVWLDCFVTGVKPLREVADKLLVSALSPSQAASASACFANKWRVINPTA